MRVFLCGMIGETGRMPSIGPLVAYVSSSANAEIQDRDVLLRLSAK